MTALSGSELRNLRVFTTIVRAGGIAGAQLALNLSQSTVSTHLAALEQGMGVRLCHRGRGGFRLTEAGQVVFDAARELLSAAENFRARTASLRGSMAGALRIGIVDATVGNPYLPLQAILKRFGARAPEVLLDVIVADPVELEQQLLSGRRDIGIGVFSQQVKGLHYEPLYVEEQGLYCGVGHPLFSVSNREVTLERVRASPFVARSYLHRLDVERLGYSKAAATVQSMEAQATVILTGRYVGFLPSHYAATWVNGGQMRALLPNRLRYLSPFFAAYRRGAEDGILLQAFLADLDAERTIASNGPFARQWRYRGEAAGLRLRKRRRAT